MTGIEVKKRLDKELMMVDLLKKMMEYAEQGDPDRFKEANSRFNDLQSGLYGGEHADMANSPYFPHQRNVMNYFHEAVDLEPVERFVNERGSMLHEVCLEWDMLRVLGRMIEAADNDTGSLSTLNDHLERIQSSLYGNETSDDGINPYNSQINQVFAYRVEKKASVREGVETFIHRRREELGSVFD